MGGIMRLKNKKTGEIVDFRYLQSDHVAPLVLTTYKNDKPEMCSYNSLAELNAEWEDYDEPKEIYFRYREARKEIGNYFETKEEAEKAVEKLRAWKRLKDNGFRFTHDLVYGDYYGCGSIRFIISPPKKRKSVIDDLESIFGGEE